MKNFGSVWFGFEKIEFGFGLETWKPNLVWFDLVLSKNRIENRIYTPRSMKPFTSIHANGEININ